MSIRIVFVFAGTCLFSACASYSPCPPPLLAAGAQADRACRVDGCTLAPDFTFASCCDAHDVAYWQGGSRMDRLAADQQFRACVTDKSNAVAAWLYYAGVRVGGAGFLPTPWRWGFGWNYPRTAPAENQIEKQEQSPIITQRPK